MNINFVFLLLTGILVGAVSGYLGSFMVMKRMSLVGDALSHVALPGMAVALMFALNPMVGAFIALALAIVGVWYLSEHSEVYPEALVGVFFTASLAIGILITPEPELLEALFGNIEKVTVFDGVAILAIGILIFAVTKTISKKLLLGVVSEDLAKSAGINTQKINLVYLLLVGLVVALGVKFVGTLLMGALVIIPAVTAKNIAKNIKTFQLSSIIFGTLSVVIGIVVSRIFAIPSGPSVVLASIFFFVVSYFLKAI